MQTRTIFCAVLLTLIPNLFSSAPKLPLIPKVFPSPYTNKVLRLSARDDELPSMPKLKTFVELALPKPHSTSSAIP